jgi:hypothetical protein
MVAQAAKHTNGNIRALAQKACNAAFRAAITQFCG